MKIGLLITARLKSSRLPMKLLLDLNGKTIIDRVIDRSKQVANIDNIILCTSTNKQDKPLTDVSLSNNIHYYLGSEEDVLQRLLDAAKFFSLDYILSITGENPLFSVDHANRIADKLVSDNADFVVFSGLPIGCSVYGLKTKALEVVCSIKKEIDTEIWGPLIDRPEIFKVIKMEVDSFYAREPLRLTTDYLEDYGMMQAIFSYFSPSETPSLYSALDILDKHPEILDINSKRVQASLRQEVIDRINKYYTDHQKEITDLKNKIYNDDY